MKTATASQPAADNNLSQALAATTAAAKLRAFCHTTGCDPLELSADGGASLDLLRVLEAMRKRGYAVSTPVKPQAQVVRDHTTWLVTVGIAGARVVLAVPIPQEQP